MNRPYAELVSSLPEQQAEPTVRPEDAVFDVLVELGKQPGRDFTYRSRVFGGRPEAGGFVIDFMFYNPPDLAINLIGPFADAVGSATPQNNILLKEILAGQGRTLIFIDGAAAVVNAGFFVREALRYRDHSRLVRG